MAPCWPQVLFTIHEISEKEEVWAAPWVSTAEKGHVSPPQHMQEPRAPSPALRSLPQVS